MKEKTNLLFTVLVAFIIAGVVNVGAFFILFGGMYPLEIALLLSGALSFGVGYLILYAYRKRKASENSRRKIK